VDKRRPSTGNRIKLNLRSHSMHGNDESQRGIQVRPRILLLNPQSTNLSEEFLLISVFIKRSVKQRSSDRASGSRPVKFQKSRWLREKDQCNFSFPDCNERSKAPDSSGDVCSARRRYKVSDHGFGFKYKRDYADSRLIPVP
jgi:hypothetical protein